MIKPATAALAALVVAACESSPTTAPGANPESASPPMSIQHGDGTAESPYYWVSPGEWATTYSFDENVPLYEGEAAPCPTVYRGTLWLNIDIANVGVRRFWFQGPMYWTRTIAPGFATYDLVVPGVDERGEWTASGPVVAECRRGLIPGLGMIRLTDHLGQLRRNGIKAGSGCEGGDPWGDADPIYMTSYEPYAPAGDEDAAKPSCGGEGGSSAGGSGYTCTWDYITIEISRDGGQSWETFWSGWAQSCEQNMT